MRATCAAVLTLAMAATPALARAEAVTLNVGGLEKQIYLPAKLAEALGYYKDEGLDVTLESEGAGVEGADALVAGEVEGVVGFYDHTIDLASKGKHAESIVQFSRAPGEVELVSVRIADKVKTFADLKGKSLGVTGLGSSTNFLTLVYERANAGLKPVSEVSSAWRSVRRRHLPDRACSRAPIDGGMTTEPTISRALSAPGSPRCSSTCGPRSRPARRLAAPIRQRACTCPTTMWPSTPRRRRSSPTRS